MSSQELLTSLCLAEDAELKEQNPWGSQEPRLRDACWAGTGSTITGQDPHRQDSG